MHLMSRLLLCEAMLTQQRHEDGVLDRFAREAFVCAADEGDYLLEPTTDGDDQPTTSLQLLHQRDGHVGRSCADQDPGEWRLLRNAVAAVTDEHLHVVTQLLQDAARGFGEGGLPLDRDH